jgi:pilus assembly protein CpaE
VTQIAVLTHDEKIPELLRSSGLKPTRIDIATLNGYALVGEAPQVLVIDVRDQGQLPANLAAVRRRHPSGGAVLIVSSLEPRLMLDAMRAGVTECVAEPLTGKAIEEAVRRVLTNAVPEQTGQMFAFVGAKGGVGTTTVAVNTAAAIARVVPGGVLLVDLHTGHGDGALFLGVEPRFSVLDAIDNVHKVDESFFAGVVEKTEAGVDLLASPAHPRHAVVDGKRVRALLDTARQMYRTTVLDVPRSDMTMLDALDTSTAIVVVTSQELASLRNAAMMSETLRNRYGAARVKVIVNRFHQDAVIAQADVERALGGSVKHMLPSDYRRAVDALNAGRPVVLDTDTKLGSAFKALARDLAGIVKERTERPSGMLGRLAWRRA